MVLIPKRKILLSNPRSNGNLLQQAVNAAKKFDKITTSEVDFTVLGTDNVVATINASTEGIDITADKIAIDGTTTFTDGYNPNTKRQVYITTPVVPYWVGDLWADGSILKRCTTQRLTGSYTAGDWVLATGYTDDTTANTKIKTFVQDGVPTSLQIGDYWIDSNDSNKLYIAKSAGADAVTAGEWELVDIVPNINAGATTISGGKVLISGSTVLTDWASASDATLIDGGDIYTRSLTVEKFSAPPSNTVMNGGGEEGGTSGVTHPTKWLNRQTDSTEHWFIRTAKVGVLNPHTGNYMIAVNGIAEVKGIQQTTMPCSASEVYYAECWVARDGAANGTVHLYVEFLDSAGSQTGFGDSSKTSSATSSDTWYKLTVQKEAPSTTALVRIVIESDIDHTTDSWYYDDIIMYKSSINIVQGDGDGTRVQINGDGIKSFDSGNNETFHVDSSTGYVHCNSLDVLSGIGFQRFFLNGIQLTDWTVVALTVAAGVGNYSQSTKNVSLAATAPTWEKYRRFKTRVKFDDDADQLVYIIMGFITYGGSYNERHVGFRIASNTVYGHTGDGTDLSETSSLGTITAGSDYLFESYLDPDNDLAWFSFNGGTWTSLNDHLPTGTTDSQYYRDILLANASAGDGKELHFEEWDFFQVP